LVDVRGLRKSFGRRRALAGIDLRVTERQIVAITGPDGAGKTTLLRSLAGLLEIEADVATVLGYDLRGDVTALKAHTGYVPQSFGLQRDLTVADNLRFTARLHRMPEETARARADALLARTALAPFANRLAGALSGGMKQKLAIARALLHEPDLLFLDEPTAALDPEAAYIVRDAISRLRTAGRTIVLATHNLDEADRLCDRIAFVRGSLLRIDSPARLRGALGGRGVEIALDGPLDDRLLASVRLLPGVGGLAATDGRLSIGLDDPTRDTPDLVRALVAAGAGIVEVRERAASLEDVYFEVMGVRPGTGGEAA
jgi:ABC-2 type transport system ATP-binding protein